MANVIKQIVHGDGYTQSIKMLVRDNERGPQGEQGEQGQAATITAGNAYSVPTDSQPAVMNTGTGSNAVFDFYIPKGEKGEKGEPGVVQYKAGRGIYISKDNIITATGGGSGGGGAWGEIVGNIEDQTDLQQEFAKYTKTANLATVATSGSYNDLSNKPAIPAAQVQSDWNQTNSEAVDFIKNKPTIPSGTINDATLTIQKNGSTVATFTANSATNTTANITVPNITMTSTDPGQGSMLAANNFVGVYGADPIIMDYSTSEINTGAKWVNGKTIYKKSFNVTTDIEGGTVVSYGGDLTGAGIDEIIKVEAIARPKTSDSSTYRPIPSYRYINSTNHWMSYLITKNASIDLQGNDSYLEAGKFFFTLYYTKSS